MATYKLVDEEKLDAAMTATADAIRAKTGSTDPIAWDAEKGMSEAVEGISADSYYDAFWDEFQNFGNRTNYRWGFYSTSGNGVWTDKNYNPKYPINISSSDSLENALESTFQGAGITDTKVCINACGARLAYTFLQCYRLTTVRKLIVNSKTTFYRAFDADAKLENIVFEGEINDGGLVLQFSYLLSKDSIVCIINSLATTATGLTVTLSLTAVNTAFETSTGAADGSASEEWAALIATKPNWTISLA